MGALGKDLFDLSRSSLRTKVQFGEAGYWVESNPEEQPYGTVLTEILNFDVQPVQDALDTLEHVVAEDDLLAAPEAFLSAVKVYTSLPFYRIFTEQIQEMTLDELVAGDKRDVLAKWVLESSEQFRCVMRQRISELLQIQERYGWFLDTLFRDAVFEKKKGQRKEPLAGQVVNRGLSAFVSGVSLGESAQADAPQIHVQYAVLEQDGRESELVEKMCFERILDFVYVEFMRGMQKGFVPKRCANCGRWFLQKPGATYVYCDGPAPGQAGKTCREVGSLYAFQNKVRSNEVWKVYQRAYKKYFARMRKGAMSKTDFEAWTKQAEVKRDRVLEAYNQCLSEEVRKSLAEELANDLNHESPPDHSIPKTDPS